MGKGKVTKAKARRAVARNKVHVELRVKVNGKGKPRNKGWGGKNLLAKS